MLSRRFLHGIFYVLACVSIAACSSAKVKIDKDLMPASLRSLAVLPVEYPATIQREKVDAIAASIKSELKNKNFVVLADKIVSQTCSSPACPERKVLADKYFVDAFVAIEVRSVSRTNFLAGFYNAIKGKLIVSDAASRPLVEVEHTQSEKGGLLFNSGQIVQAFISYGENKEADSFSKLSTGFAQTLVSKIPRPKEAVINADAVAVAIAEVKVKQLKPEVFQVCAKATEGSLVSVIVNRQNTSLRPVSEGHYCGTFLYSRLSSSQAATIEVDARSPFGNSVRKEVEIGHEAQICDLTDNVLLSEKNGRPAIQISSPCPDNKFIVFRASSDLGPYEKVAEIRGTSWIDNSAKKGGGAFYELVSVNKAGIWSLPETAKPVINKG